MLTDLSLAWIVAKQVAHYGATARQFIGLTGSAISNCRGRCDRSGIVREPRPTKVSLARPSRLRFAQ
jgi:hypothetical protein